MYCVIQEVETKKQNKHGYAKELKTSFTESSLLGRYAWYYYSEERFERPIKKAYRISIHESYRKDGKVHKKQFAICTVNYYDLATDFFSLYDWGNSRIEAAAEALDVEADALYDLIEKRLCLIQERVVLEFQQTEEYIVHQEHERITTLYAAAKVQFNEKYGTSGKEYDQCYDVFGHLHNPEKLREIEAEYKSRSQYDWSGQQGSSYYEDFYSNYSLGGEARAEADKPLLKQFYRTLSKAYHPDSNPGKDTSEEMKLLNQLKDEWGV